MTPTNASIVGATIAMAHSLGLHVIAEGVETEEQRKFLASRDCDRIQGYLIAKPMPEADFLDLVRLVNGQPTPTDQPGVAPFGSDVVTGPPTK